MNTRTVINRVAAWETQVSAIRQQLIALERDLESFKNFCEDEDDKETKNLAEN